ncbi:MAG: hypothetical protein JST40_06785 [Armatimonadetes bacterium]|nr:hypothetical protein [Armatimonadota bacterium]
MATLPQSIQLLSPSAAYLPDAGALVVACTSASLSSESLFDDDLNVSQEIGMLASQCNPQIALLLLDSPVAETKVPLSVPVQTITTRTLSVWSAGNTSVAAFELEPAPGSWVIFGRGHNDGDRVVASAFIQPGKLMLFPIGCQRGDSWPVPDDAEIVTPSSI